MPQLVSADHIGNTSFEPQRKSNFTVRIPIGSTLIQFSLDTFDFPKEANEVLKVNFGNEERKVAGRATYNNLNLVLKDFADQPVMQQILAWRRLVYNPANGAIGYASQYKRQGDAVWFGPDGSGSRRVTLVGAWPSSIDMGSGDMNGNDQNKITAVITIDRVIA